MYIIWVLSPWKCFSPICLRNIELRNYVEKDRWVILRDGEELFCVILGREKLSIRTKEPVHIKILSFLATDPWLRSKKI